MPRLQRVSWISDDSLDAARQIDASVHLRRTIGWTGLHETESCAELSVLGVTPAHPLDAAPRPVSVTALKPAPAEWVNHKGLWL